MTTPPAPAIATLIVSPLASRIRDGRVRRRIVGQATDALRARGHREVVVVETGAPEEIRQAAATAVRDGASVIAVAGGDGTLRDAAAAIAGTGVSMGIVPCGTGNLYASSIGVPRNIDRAVAALATGVPLAFDMGDVRVEPPVAGAGGPAGSPPPPAPMPFLVACGTG
ncbi:MAG: hypothetical protein MUQ32_07665, partial [Chloroflexi bacterium]|nr:hypothetical protein [Chloroflexota bacterium]